MLPYTVQVKRDFYKDLSYTCRVLHLAPAGYFFKTYICNVIGLMTYGWKILIVL